MQAKALFISHGGGPMPLLGDPGHKEMVATLKQIAAMIEKPSAIVVVSAHWEAAQPTITSAPSPSLIYDYYGFPPESYEIQYPCAGHPALAQEIYTALNNSGIEARLDPERGFDHGLFVPLKIMYPQADIPCVQLSLVNTLDPLLHIQMGQALRSLPDKNILILGSGFSFHNLRAFFSADTTQTREWNLAFEQWLIETCSGDHSPEERMTRLVHWAEAKGALFCHPREEHLLPLHLCYGVTDQPATEIFTLNILNKASSIYLW